MWRWRSSREISKNWARSFEIDTVRVGIKPAPKPLNGGLTAGWRSVDPFDGGPGCVWRLQTDPHELRKLGKCQPRMDELGGSHRVSTSHASCWTWKSVEIRDFRSGTTLQDCVGIAWGLRGDFSAMRLKCRSSGRAANPTASGREDTSNRYHASFKESAMEGCAPGESRENHRDTP
jgi:hypothetical protein